MNFIGHNRIDIEKTDIAAGLFHARFCEFYRLHVYTWQSPRESREHLKSHFTEWASRNLPGSTLAFRNLPGRILSKNLLNVSLDLWALAAVKE